MFSCLETAKVWKREMTIRLKLMTIEKNCEGENNEQENLEAAANRLAGSGDVYRTQFDVSA